MVRNRNREKFKTEGLLKVENYFSKDLIEKVHSALWEEISTQFGIRLEDKSTHPKPSLDNQDVVRLNNMNPVMRNLQGDGVFKEIEEEISSFLSESFPDSLWKVNESWYSLINFPGNKKTWEVPKNSWHNDIPIVSREVLPWSIFVFIPLDEVAIDHGPTLVIPRSHLEGLKLADEFGVYDKNSIDAFKSTNKDLALDFKTTKLLPVGKLLPLLREGGVFTPEKSFKPLIGGVGDMILFDPRGLHTGSSNISNSPRQMIRIDFRLSEKPSF